MNSASDPFVLRDPASLPARLRGGALAIGNFDGVHLGHRAVLDRTIAIARQAGVASLALTFEPHPRSFFRPEAPVFRLTPSPVKADLIAALGFDGMVELGFDADLAGLAPDDFVARILVGRLGARHVVVGHDFHYGRKRAGSPQSLIAEGERHGFEVTVVAPARAGDTLYSSSEARARLAEGRVEAAAEILGYPWFVRGTVLPGARRGRELGYPTANLQLAANCELRHGVYAVRVRLGETTLDGVASYGRRPQFDDGAPLLEVYLFDFEGDLYGRELDVAFIGFLRDEARFEFVEALIRQMDEDARAARTRLAAEPETTLPPSAANRTG